MQRLLFIVTSIFLLTGFVRPTYAAGVSASGGGKQTAGKQFVVTITASGAEFDSLQGTIAVTGPATVVSVSRGSATWLPGKEPSANGQFVGITSSTSSLVVARITLRGNSEGSGTVTVSGVKLAKAGSVVGSSGGTASYTIQRAPTPPGAVTVSSSSHPDSNQAYAVTTISLGLNKPNCTKGFSYLIDQVADTVPAPTVTDAATSATYEKPVGTYWFHIRANNADGWSGTTHFPINIKEPDPVIDQSVVTPVILSVTKATDFSTNIETGTISNVVLKGTGAAGHTLRLQTTPAMTDSAGQPYSVVIDPSGNWEIILNGSIAAGLYRITAQSQVDKTLSPVSAPVSIEFSLAKGGFIGFITERDTVLANAPTPTPSPTPTPAPPAFWEKPEGRAAGLGAAGAFVLSGIIGLLANAIRRRRLKAAL